MAVFLGASISLNPGLSYLELMGRHFCEGFIVSKHIPTGET